MTNHLQRIQSVEKEVARLGGSTAVKEDVTRLRNELKKVYVSTWVIDDSFPLVLACCQDPSGYR